MAAPKPSLAEIFSSKATSLERPSVAVSNTSRPSLEAIFAPSGVNSATKINNFNSRKLVRKPTAMEMTLTPVPYLAEVAGKGLQRLEATVAEPAMNFLRTKYPRFGETTEQFNPLEAAKRGFQGRSFSSRKEGEHARIGDVVKEAGSRVFGVDIPDLAADATGFYLSGVGMNKAIKGGAQAAKFGGKVARRFGQEMEKQTVRRLGGAEGVLDKAQKLTTEILNPPIKDMANAMDKGIELPAIREATKYTKGSQSYKDLWKTYRDQARQNMARRNAIIGENDFELSSDYVDDLFNYIKREAKAGRLTDDEVDELNKLAQEELDVLSKNPKFKRSDAQSRKEFLQNKTKPLLQKAKMGMSTARETARQKGQDVLRSSLMKKVEGGNEEIRALNDTYEGLMTARKLAAKQYGLMRKSPAVNPIIDVVDAVRTGGRNIPTEIAKAALRQQGSLPKTTKEIEKLMSLYEKYGPKPRTFRRGADEIVDVPYEVVNVGRRTLGQIEPRKMLEAPASPRMLTAENYSEFGPGFEIVPKSESNKRLARSFEHAKAEATKYYKPKEVSSIIAPESEVSGTSIRLNPKDFGIDPFTGKLDKRKTGVTPRNRVKKVAPKTALQIALERDV